MKKLIICSVAALAILMAYTVGMADEGKKAKKAEGRASVQAKRAEKKEASEAEKQWREKLAAMTPEQRRVAILNKAFEEDVAPWKEVRAVAVEEKATKTIAAIDKIIAAKTELHNKRLAALNKAKTAGAGKKPAATRRAQRQAAK